jgi:hypothetical protein
MKIRLPLLRSAFAIVFALGGGTAWAAPCTVPGTHASIQAAVSDGACDPIDVAPGIYTENVTISRSVTINGAQAGTPVAGRTFGVGESTVHGLFTILAANVTIDGFSVTNPGQNFAIRIRTAGDNAFIANNIVQTVGSTTLTANPAAIYLELGPDGVQVVGNDISKIASIPTAQGILIGDSTSSNPSENILIEGNSISEILSVTRGAYGIQVNNGASTATTATGFTTVEILNNTIDNLIGGTGGPNPLGGGWAHAIGLEGDTPGVVVEGNSISNVVDATPDIFGNQNAIAVFFENNLYFATGRVNFNNFDVTIAAYGIAVSPVSPTTALVDGTCNWWGDPNGPGPVGPGLGARVSDNVDYTPWLTTPAPVGGCVGGASTPGKVTGGGQIPGEDPLFSPLGDLLSLPALTVSASSGNGTATFGFVVKCCPETGNLEYKDQGADIRIKATSIDGLSISSPTAACALNPEGKHATFTGTADVIRSTGTLTDQRFTVEVDDCGEPGTADTFGIRTTGYSNGPSTLIGGNIQIH